MINEIYVELTKVNAELDKLLVLAGTLTPGLPIDLGVYDRLVASLGAVKALNGSAMHKTTIVIDSKVSKEAPKVEAAPIVEPEIEIAPVVEALPEVVAEPVEEPVEEVRTGRKDWKKSK